ncbi:hypothetical protein QBC41DRAFT_359443 [Cercophora samala]|uniref:DUF7907 domain-containing protein n=1 Tax=Cercophora samala TaxID=330535 RepID=A0AA39Z3R4_9PEZI|nr:hypothetical protein QBC41DRAFT_359443 [Cercophora samala]
MAEVSIKMAMLPQWVFSPMSSIQLTIITDQTDTILSANRSQKTSTTAKMHTFLLLSTLLGLASAAPTSSTPTPRQWTPQDPGSIPRHSGSRGFRLRVNVTDPSLDLNPPVHNLFLSTAHIGPAQNRAVVSSSGPIFYQNGTYADIANYRAGILTDAGPVESPFPEAIQYQQGSDDTRGSELFISAGTPGTGTAISKLTMPYSTLQILEGAPIVKSFIVCGNTTIPYYGESRKFEVVNWLQATRDSTGTHLRVPEGCVAVNLVPECAYEFGDLPEGAAYDRTFVNDVRCYESVAAIDWSKYAY